MFFLLSASCFIILQTCFQTQTETFLCVPFLPFNDVSCLQLSSRLHLPVSSALLFPQKRQKEAPKVHCRTWAGALCGRALHPSADPCDRPPPQGRSGRGGGVVCRQARRSAPTRRVPTGTPLVSALLSPLSLSFSFSLLSSFLSLSFFLSLLLLFDFFSFSFSFLSFFSLLLLLVIMMIVI